MNWIFAMCCSDVAHGEIYKIKGAKRDQSNQPGKKKDFRFTCECGHTLLRLCYALLNTQLERFRGYLYHVKCLWYTSDMQKPQFVLGLLIKNRPASDKTQTLTEELLMENLEWMQTWWFLQHLLFLISFDISSCNQNVKWRFSFSLHLSSTPVCLKQAGLNCKSWHFTSF